MMTSSLAAFCLSQMNDRVSVSQHQIKSFISAKEGENWTLKLFPRSGLKRIHWYKQRPGQESRLMYTWHHSEMTGTLYEEFNNPRFSLDTENHHLTISNLSPSDSAFYYCVMWTDVLIELNEITFVAVTRTTLKVPSSIVQSVSEPGQPKDPVNLYCTVSTGSCDEEHSVYWFRESEGSQPGLIYTQEGSNDQCEGEKNKETHACRYNLPVESLNHPHTGTYYCAVAACRQILFGGGTKLEIDKCGDSVILYCLIAVLVIALVAVACLSYLLCRKSSHSAKSEKECSASPAGNTTQSRRGADDIHYAALDLNVPRGSRKQRTHPDNEGVYSVINLS